MAKLKKSFFVGHDVVLISRQLLGKHLFTRLSPSGGKGHTRVNDTDVTGGIIIETEAYAGPEDRASHAYANRRTKRTDVMFHEGGVAYVYLCYGIHSLFNIITNTENIPHAVLVRAILPTHGIDTMLKRRGRKESDHRLAGGPGCLTQALGIDTSHNGLNLTGNRIWLEDRGRSGRPKQILTGPRIGVAYAGADAKRPWRFRMHEPSGTLGERSKRRTES